MDILEVKSSSSSLLPKCLETLLTNASRYSLVDAARLVLDASFAALKSV